MTNGGDGRDDVGGDVRWVSYDELAEARGISRESAIRLSFRRKWRRRGGNDKTARVAVPQSELTPKKLAHDAVPDDISHVVSQLTDVFSVAVSSVTSRAERAEAEAAEARASVKAAEAETTQARNLLKQAGEALTAERAARVSAETKAVELREELAEVRAETEAAVETAKADIEAAEEAAAKAEETAQAAKTEAAQVQQKLEQARAAAAKAQRTADELRAKPADAGAADRAVAISVRIDEAKFRRLQEAEEARQRLGLWGRLKDAWRGK